MERLYFLTLLGNGYLSHLGDHARRRALLETSLETLSLPRHIQVMRSQLANAAAKEGDVDSAEQWLRPCNPSSDDLQTDTAFRVARAYTDTVRRDFQRVIAMLGDIDDGYPISDAWDPLAAALRANALERLGRGDDAVTALRMRMQRGGAIDRAALDQVRESNPELELCPESFPIAARAHDEVASRGFGGLGTIFTAVGVAVLLLGLLILLVTGIPVFLIVQQSGAPLGWSLFAGSMGPLVVLATTVPIGVIFTMLGRALRKRA